MLLLPSTAPALALQGGELTIRFDSLRNQRGVVRLCLTRNPAHFPDCQGDPQSRRATVPAAAGQARFTGLPVGDNYAISAVHDENGNGRLDTFVGVPREGFGFSNNPGIGFGPPSYQRVRFAIGPAANIHTIRFRYIV